MYYQVTMTQHLNNAHFDIVKTTTIEAIDEKHAKRKALKYFEDHGWYNADITSIAKL